MLEKSEPLKRSRGVILSLSGWQRLQAASKQLELQNNVEQPYTLDEISKLTGLCYNTLSKIQHRKVAVDCSTLEVYFNTFGLMLQGNDYIKVPKPNFKDEVKRQQVNQGPLSPDSPFYINRPPIEAQCDGVILKPGALIRIKAPWQMGKTSLIIQTLSRAREQELQTLLLSMRLASTSMFSDLERLLHWICAVVTRNLGLSNRLEDYWDELFGASYNCTHYLEKCVLAEIDIPVVLALDDVDIVFQYPAIANDFFGLLRVWYEKSKYGDQSSGVWQKLRLVVAHSTEVYIPLNINQSPFSVGLSIQLSEFTFEQVQELVQRHKLNWSDKQVKQLMALVGGNPHLVQVALHQIKQQAITLNQLRQTAISPNGIYNDHLQRQLRYLQQYPELLTALTQVMTSPIPVELDRVQAFKLQSTGLVKLHERQVTPSCQLYQRYFGSLLPRLE